MSEVETYITHLREARKQILESAQGLDAEGLNWRPLPETTNSVYALVVHTLGAERRWIHAVVGRRPIERDREAEFRARGDDVTALHVLADKVAHQSEEILARLTATDLDAQRETPKPYTVRACIVHVLEHYYEHLGQMRLTRQLWENRYAHSKEI